MERWAELSGLLHCCFPCCMIYPPIPAAHFDIATILHSREYNRQYCMIATHATLMIEQARMHVRGATVCIRDTPAMPALEPSKCQYELDFHSSSARFSRHLSKMASLILNTGTQARLVEMTKFYRAKRDCSILSALEQAVARELDYIDAVTHVDCTRVT